MAKLLTSTQMQQADRRTIEELGLPGMVLMENAGQGVVRILKERLQDWRHARVLILAGTGNNGGDGFVVARQLLQEGLATTVLLFGPAHSLQGDAKTNHGVYQRLGGRIREILKPEDLTPLPGLLAHAGILIDALFGTGLTRPITGIMASAIQMVNLSRRPVLAVDIPSGVSADSGQILGIAIQARWTVTFAAEKIGHRVHPGAALCGEVVLVGIGIPKEYLEIHEHSVARNLPDDLTIPPRPQEGHKGHFGHLFVLAGSVGKEGAAALTALGAQCIGTGLVTVATPGVAQPQVSGKLLEAMTLPLADDGATALAPEALEEILKQSVKPTALAMGPGLGQGIGAAKVVMGLLEAWPQIPIVVDADGLNVLAMHETPFSFLLAHRKAVTVLTPHPGEMARLVRQNGSDIQANRLDVAREVARQSGAWVVLKGAGTLIASPSGPVWINDTGNSGLASGGSGDLLTGIIAGFLAQGWPVESAVRAGVWLHGKAADKAALEQGGEAGILAGELLPKIRHLRNQLG